MTDTNAATVPEPVAIIGYACRIPGACDDPDRFWDLLRTGTDALVDVPRERWNVEKFYHPRAPRPGKLFTRRGGFISNVDRFDAGFFGISPREARSIDPQQRLVLEVGWEALEHGGQVATQLRGSSTGVFVGASTTDYMLMANLLVARVCDPYVAIGSALSLIGNRLSYALDLRGPSMVVDTACSSSLVATHLACQSIRAGESTLAVVAGVNVMLLPSQMIHFVNAGVLSPDSRCKAMDDSANGYVRSEAAVALVLKSLARAQADGDPIRAVILGSAVTQDGQSDGVMAPNRAAQESTLRHAYARAGVDPASVQYVEAHGTGTAIGDLTEAHALGAIIGAGRPSDAPCRIGSVKTNVGHTEAAAGCVSLLKVTLMLERGAVPPSLHFHTPNRGIPFDELRLRVQTAFEPWPTTEAPRRVGVNGFGIGGTNAHVILEQAPAAAPRADAATRSELLVLSGHTQAALAAQAERLHAWLAAASPVPLTDLAYTLAVRREHHAERHAIVARDTAALTAALAELVAEARAAGDNVSAAPEAASPPRRLVFLYCGQGPQWWGMGRRLLAEDAVVRAAIQACSDAFQRHAGWSLMEALAADEAHSRIDETAVAQPALVALQIGLHAWWRARGITPDAMIGHSVGEVTAAHLSGVLSLDDAMRVIYHRSRLMARAAGRNGGMLYVAEGERAVRSWIAASPDPTRLDVAAVNGPASVTVAGDLDAVHWLQRDLEARDVFCKALQVECAFHSHHMDGLEPELAALLADLAPGTPVVPVYSTLTGGPAAAGAFAAAHWAREVRAAVRFADATTSALADGPALFVELGPHPVLGADVKACAHARGLDVTVLPSLRREADDRETLLAALGAIHVGGYAVDWRGEHPEARTCVTLPTYAWQRDRCWLSLSVDEGTELPGVSRAANEVHPLLGLHTATAHASRVHIFEVAIDLQRQTYLTDHRVRGSAIFPAAAMLAMAFRAATTVLGAGPRRLDGFRIEEALLVPEDGARAVQVIVTPTAAKDASCAIWSRADADDQTAFQSHATVAGMTVLEADEGAVPAADLDAVRARCPEVVLPEHFYAELGRLGLDYGPAFRAVVALQKGDGEAIGELVLPTVDGLEDADQYEVHPVVLDAALHCLLAAFPHGALHLPRAARQVTLHAPLGARAICHVTIVRESDTEGRGTVRLYDVDGRPLLEIVDLILAEVASAESESWFHDVHWIADPTAADTAVRALPPLTDVAAALQSQFDQRAATELPSDVDALEAELERIAVDYLVRGLADAGLRPGRYDSAAIAAFPRTLGIDAQHECLFRRAFEVATEGGAVRRDADGVTVPDGFAPPDPTPAGARLIARDPGAGPLWTLVERCGRAFGSVLRGRTNALDLIFPNGAMDDAEALYRRSVFAGTFMNPLLAAALHAAGASATAERPLRILELGAGTGGTTQHVLPALPPDVRYVFTDVSSTMLRSARERFAHDPRVSFQVFDLDRDVAEQDLEPHAFDVVIAANVVHGTSRVERTLARIRHLLAPGGWAALWELTRPRAYWDLVFGMTPGWWLAAGDPNRDEYPLLVPSRWRALLGAAGFEDTIVVPADAAGDAASQSLLFARAAREPVAATTAVSSPVDGSTWVVFADAGGIGGELVAALRRAGTSTVMVTAGESFAVRGDRHYDVRPNVPEDYAALQTAVAAPIAHVVHLWSLDAPSSAALDLAGLERAQRVGCRSIPPLVGMLTSQDSSHPAPRLCLVTRGAQAVHAGEDVAVAAAPMWGIGRTLLEEHPAFGTLLLDLDPAHPIDGAELLAAVVRRGAERQVAHRDGLRFVARLQRCDVDELVDGVGVAPRPRDPRRDANYTLEIRQPGLLDSLCMRVGERRAPGPGEIEIAIAAGGLNFRDVVQALDLIPGLTNGQPPGSECAGRVVAVGPDVRDFRVGDEVLSMVLGGFSAFVTSPACEAVLRPPTIDAHDAAGIPLVFITAYHALVEKAQLQPGERVLIHAGSGGVGLAAIQIAQWIGAEVIATAGSDAKRAYVRERGVQHVFDSRSARFADDVRAVFPQGVDVVLNSLSGPLLTASLDLLAPYGRFVEIGKRDVLGEGTMQLRPLAANASFIVVDVSAFGRERPGMMGRILTRVMALMADGHLRPLPVTRFAASQITDAFRCMAQARHVGKIIVTFDEPTLLVAPPRHTAPPIRGDRSYAVLGGLGGLGLTAARWLVDAGARHLVLVGRSAPSETAAGALDALRSQGARIEVRRGDLADRATLPSVLAWTDAHMPPLAGIVHSAGALADSLLADLTDERLCGILATKVDAAWQLHELTRERALDFLCLFSSATALFGSPGQANYCAANAFLDALAWHRRACNLPTTAIAWGPWSEVGLIAQRERMSHRLGWFRDVDPTRGRRLLGEALDMPLPYVIAGAVDWRRFTTTMTGAVPTFFADVCRPYEDGVDRSSGADGTSPIREELEGAAAADRQSIIERYLRTMLARVIGLPASRIESDKSFKRMGVDSLMALELKNRVEIDLGVRMTTQSLMRGPTVRTLGESLLNSLGGAAAEPAAPPVEPGPSAAEARALLDRLDELTSDEISTLLEVLDDDAPSADDA